MAKVLTLSKKNKPQDGRFEVVMVRHYGKLHLLYKFLRASTVGLSTRRKKAKYVFRTVGNMPMQLDGEVLDLEADSTVKIIARKKALRTFI